jgi:hypothetical protein
LFSLQPAPRMMRSISSTEVLGSQIHICPHVYLIQNGV